MTKKQRRAEAILRHGFKLKRLFSASNYSPLALAKRLQRLEDEAHRLSERECCEQLPDGYAEKKWKSIERRVRAALGPTDVTLHFNGDPRGYALKIEDAYMKARDVDLYRDWGGYGILAPEF